MKKRASSLIVLSLLLAAPLAAWAQDIGSIATVAGTAELGRGGTWTTAQPGMGVRLGDQLRTTDGRMKVVFQDDSVLNLAENTSVAVDDQVFQPQQGTFKSLMKLLKGKVRATVGSVYQTPGSAYEVETPTAVAGVRGTTFLVSYDDENDHTEVLGIHGRVYVRGLNERLGDGVFITSHEATEIGAGQRASQPERLDDELYNQRLQGLEILSRGGLGGLTTGAVQIGSAVAPPDRAPLAAAKLTTSFEDLRDTASVVGQPIGQNTRGSLGVPF